MLPPSPPRHPSSRSVPPRPPAPSLVSSRPLPPGEGPTGRNDAGVTSRDSPAHTDPPPVDVAVENLSSVVAESPRPTTSAGDLFDEAATATPPPRHPKTARFSSPLPSPPLAAAPSPPPLRRGVGSESSAVERKLKELEDLETLELLERVGDQLTDVRLAGGERNAVYPERDHFRMQDGKLDWIGYATAYLVTAALDYTPPGLVAPPPPTEFSFRALRADLERLYVLCPPPVWQRLLLSSFASLWRWDNPRRTATWAAVYLVLWARDGILLFPFAFLLFHTLRARYSPPSTEELLARASDRRARTRDAAELGKQLNASGRFGLLAGEGVRGLWSEVRERLSRDDADAEEKSLAAALGSGAALGGIVGGLGGEPLRHKAGSSATSTSAPATPPAMSALARGLGSSASVLGAAAAPMQTQLDELRPPPDKRPDVTDPDYDPARGPAGEGDLSLYRLVRHLAGLFGPQILLWCDEAADICEMVKNVITHPDHPASRTVALRLALVCAVLFCAPAWTVYKVLWLYAGAEVFVLWRVRELYPEWRRATIPYWWLLVGAPTDVEYALFLLRQRSLTQRPLQGSKTLRRSSRASSTATAAMATGKRAVARRAGRALLRRARGGVGEEVLLASGESQAVLGCARPLSLRSGSASLTRIFTRSLLCAALLGAGPASPLALDRPLHTVPPTKAPRQARLAFHHAHVLILGRRHPGGHGVARFGGYGVDGRGEGTGRSADCGGGDCERAEGDEDAGIRGVDCYDQGGQGLHFANVARRDDAFNKLLSLSSSRWEQI